MSWCAPVSTCKHLWTCLFLVRMPDALPVHPDNQVSTWLCACQPCGAWRSSWAFPTAQIWAQICGRSKHARIVFLIAINLSFWGNLWQNSFPFSLLKPIPPDRFPSIRSWGPEPPPERQRSHSRTSGSTRRFPLDWTVSYMPSAQEQSHIPYNPTALSDKPRKVP